MKLKKKGIISESEKRIIGIFRKNKTEGLRLIYTEYADRLFSVCYRYVMDKQEAYDITHETMLKVYDRLPSFKYNGEGSLFRYIARVAINMILDKKKITRRHRGQINEEVWSDIPEPSVENDLEIPEEALLKMIERLTPVKRSVFNMYCIDGYSHKEIGSLLGISENGSSSILSKAKKELSSMLTEYIKTMDYERLD
ncbi:MAG: sigma-70 family RNA polymerase sigma factor [Bacteroidales bacterium]|nr:sigma-70 family RNA polymerase sigma factor [Bacteroidales bacterium]